MDSYQEIKEKMDKIRNSDFKIEEYSFYSQNHLYSMLLRDALECFNMILTSSKDKEKLLSELDAIMSNKLRELNPNFSEETLSNMILGYHKSSIVYPMDVLVIDDAVFHKEGTVDACGFIDEIQTFMFENMPPYYDVSSIYFTLDDMETSSKVKFTQEENQYISKFISDAINHIYEKNITRPTYELNNDYVFYGYDGLSSGEVQGVYAYLNCNYFDIGNAIKKKKEFDFKLCIQNEEDMILYYICQTIQDNEPVWNVVQMTQEVWKLTDAALKREKSFMPELVKNIRT